MTPRLSGAYPRACQGLDVFTVAPCALLHQKSTRPRVRRVAAGAELTPPHTASPWAFLCLVRFNTPKRLRFKWPRA